MATTVIPNKIPVGEVFVCDTVTLADVAAFAPVALIRAGGRRVTMHGKNGAADLVDLQIKSSSVQGGTLVTLATGSDLNATVSGIVAIRPAYPACLAANADWELLLDIGAADVQILAKGNNTSLTLTGMVL